jgi:hypothetical protein
MITYRQRVLWASMLATLTLASAAAFAQPAPAAPTVTPTASSAQAPVGKASPTADQQRMEPRDPAKHLARMQEHRAQRMAALKEKLQLSPAQESAWTSFTASTQPPAGTPPQRLDRAELAELAKLTTPQRLERMQARQTERTAMFAKRADATRTFYAGLNPDQQKTFDAETVHKSHGGHHGHRNSGDSDGLQAAPAKG